MSVKSKSYGLAPGHSAQVVSGLHKCYRELAMTAGVVVTDAASPVADPSTLIEDDKLAVVTVDGVHPPYLAAVVEVAASATLTGTAAVALLHRPDANEPWRVVETQAGSPTGSIDVTDLGPTIDGRRQTLVRISAAFWPLPGAGDYVCVPVTAPSGTDASGDDAAKVYLVPSH